MFSDLSWLPPPPADFRDQARKAKAQAAGGVAAPEIWSRARALASHSLDEVQLGQVAGIVRALSGAGAAPPARTVGLIGDGTLSLLGPAITASALRQNLAIQVVEGAYGAAMRDAMDPDSALRRAQPDVVILASDRRGLGLNRSTVSIL